MDSIKEKKGEELNSSLKKCVKCGGTIKKGDKYCEECGTPIGMKMKRQIDKLDLLFKLGSLMIIISGLFLIGGDNGLTDAFKVIVLLAISGVFALLSYLSRKYLKLDQTTKIYSVISFIIFVLSLFEFNECVSLETGLYYSLIFLSSTIYTYYYNKRFKSNKIYVAGAITLFLFMFEMAAYIFSMETALFIIALIVLLVKFMKIDDRYFVKVFEVIPILVYLGAFSAFFETTSLVGALTCVLAIIDSFITATKTKGVVSIIATVATYLLVLPFAAQFANVQTFAVVDVLKILSYITIYCVYNLIEDNLDKKNHAYELAAVVLGTCLTFTYVCNDNAYLFFMSAIELFAVNSVNSRSDKSYNFLKPFTALMLVMAFLNLVNENFYTLTAGLVLYILSITSFILSIKEKNKYLRNLKELIAKMFIVPAGIIAVFSDITNITNAITAMLIFVTMVEYFLISRKRKDKCSVGMFIASGMFIELLFLLNVVVPIDKVFIAMFFIIVYLGIYMAAKGKDMKLSALVLIVAPFAALLTVANVEFAYRLPLISTYLIGCVLLVHAKLEKKRIHQAVFVVSTLVLLPNLLVGTVPSAVFTGLLSLGLIIYGLVDKSDALFKLGTIFVILNIALALFNVWITIPFYIYLLCSGVLIICIGSFIVIKNKKD